MDSLDKKLVYYIASPAVIILLLSHLVESTILPVLLVGISAGLLLASFIVRFILLKEDIKKNKIEKLKEIEGFIKIHDKSK